MNNDNKIGGAVREEVVNGKIQTTPLAPPVQNSQIGGAFTNTGIISRNGTDPITPQDLQSTPSLKLPEVTQSTTAEGITGMTEGMAKANNNELSKLESQKNESQNDLKGLYDELYDTQNKQLKMEEEAKIAQKTQSLTDVTNKLEASQRAQNNELRALDGLGLTDVQKAQQSKEINRRYAFEQADLALIQSAANRDLDTAQGIIDRKIALKTQGIKDRLEYAKFVYQENKDLFTKEEDRQFQAKTKELDRKLAKETAFEEQKGKLQLEALKDGNIGLFNAIGKATDSKGLTNIVYTNTIPADGKTRAQTIAESIFQGNSGLEISELPIAQRAEVAAELNKLKQAALNSGDITGVIKASAGGKAVSDSFTQSFEKALNVIGQIDELKTALTGEKTGPIWGTIRSANPYDVKAQQIKAQLQALVPNLARGIYGEVGVLTDNDVQLYARTLANLKSTEEVNDAIMGITIKSVQRSLENKIKTQAGFGRDVSGILSTYEDVKSLADTLLAPANKQTYSGIVLPPGSNTPSTYQGISLPN
jgi:hypothetical protein